ncbi:cytochrome P450 9e2 isoform X2 [Monomorium pharaonis]|uniref:cytochrome P450 9e2 isoform X2 n=1 Tax=Monomorium pharaonis TaxID=307658 RepID=UPI00063F8B7C|nr:cytochrome P450 9e2 isoform X2 [Monomorium pharaonis]
MYYVIVLSVIAGALSLYYFLFKSLNYFKKHKVPYITAFPIVGSLGPMLLRIQSIADYTKSLYNLYPDAKYVGLYELKTPNVMLRDPELIKSVTLKHFDMFMDHISSLDESQDKYFGRNLFALRGERWRDVRSILSPAFTSSKMKKKKIMDIKDVFTRYSNDIIATCAFGIKVDSMRNPKNDFFVYGKEATSFKGFVLLRVLIIKTLPWLARILRLTIVREKITNFFEDLIKSTIKARDENGIVRPDMLQLMMESRYKDGNAELSIDDIVAQAFIFFFGGFESTATLMCFAAHEIAMNPDIQIRLQNEIDRVLEDTNGQASYEAVNGMEYLDAVINEALRMYPASTVILDRICLNDFELPPALPGLKPFVIKKGHGIWIPIYALQHDPKYFKDPEKFDPERFLGEQKKKSLNSGVYFPFGVGPRMCIGNRFALLETKVLLFHLLARCDLKPCEKTPIPIKFTKDFLLKPEGGFWLNVASRRNTHHSITTNASNETC